MSKPLVFREYSSHEPIAPITRLLHESYAQHASEGLEFLAAHQDDEATRRRLHTGVPFVAEQAGHIVGTVTLYRPDPDSLCTWYRQPQVFRFGQFAVHPDLQRQGIGSRLVALVESRACELAARQLALGTAEGNVQLRAWYEHRGYRFVQFVQWPDVSYQSAVLSKAL